MVAEDPAIKVGPGCMTANNGNAWLDAVFARSANRVDLVAYHPYGNLYGITRDSTGGVLDAAFIQRGLNVQKSQQVAAKQKIVDRLVAYNRPADTPLLLSEWNTSSWQGTYYYSLGQTMAQGLGTAEDIFSFIEMGVVASQYWDQPNIPNRTNLEVPCFKVFKAMQTYLPDTLQDSLADGEFRLYTTKDSGYQRVVLWGVNLSESAPKTVRVQLQGLPSPVTFGPIAQRKLAAYSGPTSLITYSTTTEVVGWTETVLTGQIDPADFTITFDKAALTMLIFDLEGSDAPMVVAPQSFTHTLFVGTALPDDVLTVASGGSGPLNYTLDSDVAWLSLLPSAGVSSGEVDPIAVRYDVAGLAPGAYAGTVHTASGDAYNSPQTVSISITITTAGVDFDRDGDVDVEDFGHFQTCISGSAVPQTIPACATCDLDGDSDVDQTDVGGFIHCLSGPGRFTSATCED